MAKNYVAFSVFVIRIERVFLAKKKNCIPFNMLVYSNCKLPTGFQVLTPYINSSLCVRKCVSIPKHTRSQKIENVIKIGEWKIFLKVEFDGEIYILCAFQFQKPIGHSNASQVKMKCIECITLPFNKQNSLWRTCLLKCFQKTRNELEIRYEIKTTWVHKGVQLAFVRIEQIYPMCTSLTISYFIIIFVPFY